MTTIAIRSSCVLIQRWVCRVYWAWCGPGASCWPMPWARALSSLPRFWAFCRALPNACWAKNWHCRRWPPGGAENSPHSITWSSTSTAWSSKARSPISVSSRCLPVISVRPSVKCWRSDCAPGLMPMWRRSACSSRRHRVGAAAQRRWAHVRSACVPMRLQHRRATRSCRVAWRASPRMPQSMWCLRSAVAAAKTSGCCQAMRRTMKTRTSSPWPC